MTRRSIFRFLFAATLPPLAVAADGGAPAIVPLVLSDAEWKKRLAPEQYQVLRKHGTERAGTSALNAEKRRGRYLCAGCGPLGVPATCEACSARLAETPRPRTKTKMIAWMMLLFLLGIPLIGVAILRLIYDSR